MKINTFRRVIIRANLILIMMGFSFMHCMEDKTLLIPEVTTLTGENIDEVILKGIGNIRENGELFEARAGSGQQAYDVNYILLNPLKRVHTLREPASKKYFCRELLAYFKGSLNVNEGLVQASSAWRLLADSDCMINSNYGYYVFHQKISENNNNTQYEWVISNLVKNLDSRKAFININQPNHKKLDTKDYPCTIGLQFFVRSHRLCCSVSSRSTDIYTGLPYDMGFFAFVTELIYKDLMQRLPSEKSEDLKLGYVTMKTNFTQIYDKTRTPALRLLEKFNNKALDYQCDMPEIHDAQETLRDIYNETQSTPVMKWIYKHAQIK